MRELNGSVKCNYGKIAIDIRKIDITNLWLTQLLLVNLAATVSAAKASSHLPTWSSNGWHHSRLPIRPFHSSSASPKREVEWADL